MDLSAITGPVGRLVATAQNGLEVLRTVRGSGTSSQIALISGAASPEDAVEAIKLGASEYFSKPLDLGRVRGLMRATRQQFLDRSTVLESDADLAERDARLTALQQEFDERTAWALSMQEELMQLHGEITRLAENNAQLVDATRQRDELQRHLEAVIVQRDAFEAERNRILQSRSWKLTRPLRYIARKASGLRQRLAFRWQRLVSILRRTLASLKTRGLAGTLTRIQLGLRATAVSGR